MTYTEPSKLPCPLCGSQDSRTLKTRFVDVFRHTRRRRLCEACGARFSTLEIYAPDEPTIRLHPGLLAFASSTTRSTVTV